MPTSMLVYRVEVGWHRNGGQVTVASVEGSPTVTCSRGVRLEADGLIDEYKEQLFDAISIPGQPSSIVCTAQQLPLAQRILV